MPPSWHPVPACVRHGCCRRNHSSLPQEKLVLDAEDRCRHDRSRRNYSSLPLRKLESDAERCGGRDRCRSGGFVLRIMPPSWHPVPACVRDGCCRQNHSSLPQEKLVLDAEDRCRHDRSRRNLSSLTLRRLESDAENRCRYDRSRRNHSSLPLRKLEPDAELVAATDAASGPFLTAATTAIGGTILLCGNEE